MVGILLVLVAALLLAIQNVALKIIVSPGEFLGLFPLGGWVRPTVDHALLLLQMRMLLTVPLMVVLTPRLYDHAGQELGWFWNREALQTRPSHRHYALKVIGACTCIFLALVLLYVAISSLTTGVAVTIFFIHPAITVLLAWAILGERIQLGQLGWIGLVLIGLVLTSPSIASGALQQNWLGVGAAIAAGFAYAGYSLLTQLSLQRQPNQSVLHPVTFSLLQFITMLVLATLGLRLITIDIAPGMWAQIWSLTLVSAIAAMVAYIFNNIGIQRIGATKASLISSTTPILTALLAALLIREVLSLRQIFGIVLVTCGIAALSLRFRKSAQPD
ncbi:DMT family transporter [Vacuolonema iberomarrocanum]|uniref:DMT family transporter n=1 Tax=Vacuolonema iberomarrocanum TaxID=3454632 RepID=UPI0019DC07A6|nr:DMT family transporter [filamentous cyanobacterium LEGE 07170]